MAPTNTRVILNHAVRAYPLNTAPDVESLALAPASDANFPVGNVVLPDRDVRWSCPTTGAELDLVLDLTNGASTRTFDTVGYLGLVRGGGADRYLYPQRLTVRAGTEFVRVTSLTATTGTNTLTRTAFDFAAAGVKVNQKVALEGVGLSVPADLIVTNVAVGTLTLSGNITASPSPTTVIGRFHNMVDLLFNLATPTGDHERDFGVSLPAPVSYRYVAFQFEFVKPFLLSALIVGQSYDLGFAYSPDAPAGLFRTGVENPKAEGGTTFTESGPIRWRCRIPLRTVTGPALDAFVSAVLGQRTVVLNHPTLGVREWRVVGDALNWNHVWSSATEDVYNLELELETMP